MNENEVSDELLKEIELKYEAINQKTNEEQWKAKAHKIKYQK